MPHRTARPAGSVVAVLVGALVLLLAACGGGSARKPKDMRPWFALYVSRMLTDDALRHQYGFQPLAKPYLGDCSHQRVDVSWQGTLTPAAGAGASADVSLAALGRVAIDSKLAPSQFTVVGASRQSPRLSNTVVLFPSRYSRLQVTAPLGTSVVLVGYLGCDDTSSGSDSPSAT